MSKGCSSFTLRGDDGANVQLDLPLESMEDEQRKATEKLFRAGSPKAITREEWEAIRKLRATVKGDFDPTALIVRFDWKWVRIDEPGLTFDDAQKL